MSYKKPEQEDVYLSENDVRDRLNALTEADLHRLLRSAKNLAGATHAADDLIQKAILLVLSGERRWKREMETIPFLYSAMRSIAHAEFKKKSPENKKTSIVNGDGDDIEITDTAPSTEARLIQQEDDNLVRKRVEEIFDVFKDDDEATLLLVGIADGLSASEIREQMKISKTQYETILKWIRRKTK